MANASKDSLHKMVALMPTKHDDERLDSLLQDVNNEERGEVCDVANVNSSNQVVLSGTSRSFKVSKHTNHSHEHHRYRKHNRSSH